MHPRATIAGNHLSLPRGLQQTCNKLAFCPAVFSDHRAPQSLDCRIGAQLLHRTFLVIGIVAFTLVVAVLTVGLQCAMSGSVLQLM